MAFAGDISGLDIKVAASQKTTMQTANVLGGGLLRGSTTKFESKSECCDLCPTHVQVHVHVHVHVCNKSPFHGNGCPTYTYQRAYIFITKTI